MAETVDEQCGNFMIFLSLRFYVKSNLMIVEVQNLPFFKHLQGLNFAFNGFLHFLKAEIYQINKIQSL